MPKKYDNGSVYVKDWTTKKLAKEFWELDQLINDIECFGTKDVVLQHLIYRELQRRKYKFEND